MKFIGNPILLPLSVDVASVEKYRVKHKTKDVAYAGRRIKITNQVPKNAEILTELPQSKLIQKMAKFRKVFCVGRTAIQAKILGCEIGVYDNMYPDPSVWKVLDCRDAAQMLQSIINIIDRDNNVKSS